MSTYVYERGRTRIEREYPIGKAPRSVTVKGKRFFRALTAPRVIQIKGARAGRELDYLSDRLDADLHGKFHKGRIVTNEHGERKLHFSSRDQEEHLFRAWNESAESEVHGKLRRAGDADEWADDVRRGEHRPTGPVARTRGRKRRKR